MSLALRLNQPTYYAAALRPDNYTVKKCMHPNFDITKLARPNPIQYIRNLHELMLSPTEGTFNKRRLLTGIVKPSICLGFQDNAMFAVPSCFPLDVMHLVSINIPQQPDQYMAQFIRCPHQLYNNKTQLYRTRR